MATKIRNKVYKRENKSIFLCFISAINSFHIIYSRPPESLSVGFKNEAMMSEINTKVKVMKVNKIEVPKIMV